MTPTFYPDRGAVINNLRRVLRNYCFPAEPLVLVDLPGDVLLLEVFPVIISAKTQDHSLAIERIRNVLKYLSPVNAAVDFSFDEDQGAFEAKLALVAQRSKKGDALKRSDINEKILTTGKRLNSLFPMVFADRLGTLLLANILILLLALFVIYVCDFDYSAFYVPALLTEIPTLCAGFYLWRNRNLIILSKEEKVSLIRL